MVSSIQKNTIAAVKRGGGSIMLWAMTRRTGPCKGRHEWGAMNLYWLLVLVLAVRMALGGNVYHVCDASEIQVEASNQRGPRRPPRRPRGQHPSKEHLLSVYGNRR